MSAAKSSDDQLPALWEAGIPLNDAWIEFARFFDSFAYRALRTYPANDPDVLARDPRYEQLQGWLPKTWKARKEKLLVTTTNERANLLDEIYANRLWAIGFQTLPSGSDELVRVPHRHFLFVNGVGPAVAMNWDRGELTVDGTTYFDIRVVRNPLRPDRKLARTSASERSPRSKAKKSQSNPGRRIKRASTPKTKAGRKNVGGRPNTSREIRKAFRKMLSETPACADLPHKTLIGDVREALFGKGSRDIEKPGYKYSPMDKIIGQELSEFRNKNKRNKPNKL